MGARPEAKEIGVDELARELRDRCGVRPGDVLIVHASLSRIGQVAGGGATVVAALQRALTPSGTLLMPVFSHPPADGEWSMRATPSRTGAVTEALRVADGAVRSFHPTHSVGAWGARAAEFCAGHERTSGLGVGSPFHKASDAGATILMIGCDLTSCSLVHVAEAITRPAYLGKVFYDGYQRTVVGTAADGRRQTFPPLDVPTDSQGFRVVQGDLEASGDLQRVRLGAAECLRFPARRALEHAVARLRADPAALLCANPRCSVCVGARRLVAGG